MPGQSGGNRLYRATSPYLLQHRDNPVHWYEWGEEALQTALAEDKPILLSIGYAACHWCHVMAHESFENADIARLMNDHFVNIKVDREERPDIDQIYMEGLHRLGVQGGWPLTAFLTPSASMFWGGTYFPPVSRHGLPGFPDLLRAISTAWRERRDEVMSSAHAVTTAMASALAPPSGWDLAFDVNDFDQYASESIQRLDPVLGGGSAPKFPNAPLMESLLLAAQGDSDGGTARDALLLWLKSMCLGGIYDHLGGGIHRYAVDSRWLVPHFEKMLYDNALLLRALVLARPLTKSAELKALFRIRIEETIECLCRDFLETSGGLSSSIDADSDGSEGRFYVWSAPEIAKNLPGDTVALFNQIYDVKPTGNWEGKSILHRLHFRGWGYTPAEEETLKQARSLLFEARSNRIAPGIDDKVLTDWNGMAIRAVADCGYVLDRADWIALAETLFQSVLKSTDASRRLVHSRRGARIKEGAFLTDLAAMVNAAVTLYAYTGDDQYRQCIQCWIEQADTHHADDDGSFYFTANDNADCPMRTYQDRDEATPSASGQWLEALQRAALVLSDPELQRQTDRLAERLWSRISGQPHGYSAIMNALRLNLEPRKLVIAERDGALATVARTYPDPARLDVIINPDEAPAEWKSERPAAWLCSGPVCLPPVHDPDALLALLVLDESG